MVRNFGLELARGGWMWRGLFRRGRAPLPVAAYVLMRSVRVWAVVAVSASACFLLVVPWMLADLALFGTACLLSPCGMVVAVLVSPVG